MSAGIPEKVRDQSRLRAVERLQLIGEPPAPGVRRLVELAATLLDAPLAFFTVVDDRRSWYHAASGIPDDLESGPVEASFCKYVIASGEPLVVGDASSDPRTVGNPAIESMGVAAWAGYPVRHPDGEVLGSFCVVDTKSREWSDRELELLHVLAAAADDEVVNHLTRQAELEARARIDAGRSELDALRQRQHDLLELIQQSLLPSEVPTVAGLDIALRYESANTTSGLGGDWYDVVSLTDGRAGLVIADVCGHDPQAVATMAQLRPSLHAFAKDAPNPADVLTRLHALMLDLKLERFLTIFYGVWDPTTATVRFQSAGHPTPIVIRPGQPAALADTGHTTMLGTEVVTPDAVEQEIALAVGETLIVFTDGLFERRELSFDDAIATLLGIVDVARHAPVDELAALIVDRARPAGGYEDDVALLVARRRPLAD